MNFIRNLEQFNSRKLAQQNYEDDIDEHTNANIHGPSKQRTNRKSNTNGKNTEERIESEKTERKRMDGETPLKRRKHECAHT